MIFGKTKQQRAAMLAEARKLNAAKLLEMAHGVKKFVLWGVLNDGRRVFFQYVWSYTPIAHDMGQYYGKRDGRWVKDIKGLDCKLYENEAAENREIDGGPLNNR